MVNGRASGRVVQAPRVETMPTLGGEDATAESCRSNLSLKSREGGHWLRINKPAVLIITVREDQHIHDFLNKDALYITFIYPLPSKPLPNLADPLKGA